MYVKKKVRIVKEQNLNAEALNWDLNNGDYYKLHEYNILTQ